MIFIATFLSNVNSKFEEFPSIAEKNILSEKTDVIRYSCTQLSLSAGIYPRIQINTKEKKVALEYSGFDLSDIFHFQDSLIESVDTLETIAAEEELFINENQKTLTRMDKYIILETFIKRQYRGLFD